MSGKDWIPVGYVPLGDLSGIPMEIIERMLGCQHELSGGVSLPMLENNVRGGFYWDKTSGVLRIKK